jgi:large subunit ribosomal protein L9
VASHIRIVLTDDLHNIGKSGDLVRVRPGFARNYLIPRGLAVGASARNVARIEHEKKVAEARAIKQKSEATELAAKLSAVKVTITRPVGEGDRLYGSVTSRDVEEALASLGHVVDKRRISMDPLKALGTYSVSIRLATEVTATVDVTVAKKA